MEKGDDPYKILGITKAATEDEVKKAYRKLALKHHPDRQSDPKAKDEAQHIFAKISGAYEILGDDKQRKTYDSMQNEQKKSGGKPKGFDERQMDDDFHFMSPYEVWKRDFESQFGFPYPGAAYDFVDASKQIKNGSAASPADDTTDKKKKKGDDQKRIANEPAKEAEKPKGFFGRLFGGRKNPEDETALVLHNGDDDAPDDNKKKKDKSNKSSSSNKSKDTTLANPSAGAHETALVKSYGVEGDNRPISMETTTKQVKHDDGTIETITEIKIVRPDGSIERCRTSDCAEKRKDWRQKETPKKDAKLALTNGEERKALTNGENTKAKKAITNGESSSSKKKSSSSKKKSSSSSSTALTVKE